ncbi:hypothetical protein KRZ98_17455 [Sphingobium sp. AS12]|uniref:hypothetical protein n=1 Tax=Sphingobium sp. AS12 TaxID=2849495 RepID=UPI001C314FA6|nr:hypothetical protein [Sphingobium sp. AS12]MBV2150032.1 hypothetical protein [Sphingobium sp. AS12]
MKLRFRSALPPLDRTARLPLALAALLAAAIVMQLVLVDAVELPPPGPVGRVGVSGASASDPERSTGGAAILARSMFAPSGGPSAGSGAGALGGMTIAGSIRIGRSTFAVVQGPGSRTSRVPVGGRIGDWRLRAVRASEVLLERGEEKIIVPFGAGTPLPANVAATGS